MDLLVSKVLKTVLSNYVKSCPSLGSGNDIKVGVNSVLHLKDVQLKEEVMRQMLLLPQQISVLNASCAEMDVTVPLALMKKPIIIQAKGIRLQAKEDTEGEFGKTVLVIKNTSKKSKRQIIDTILLNVTDFIVEFETGDTKLIVSFDTLSTYFANDRYEKVNEVPQPYVDGDTVNFYRVLEVSGLNVKMSRDNKEFNLLRNVTVSGQISQKRDAETYQLIDTNVRLNINKLRLLLLTEEYMSLSKFLFHMITLYTSSLVLRNESTKKKNEITKMNRNGVQLLIGTVEITVKNDNSTQVLRFVTEKFKGNVIVETIADMSTLTLETGVSMVEMMYEMNGVGKRVLSGFGDHVLETKLMVNRTSGVLDKIKLDCTFDGVEVSLESDVVLQLIAFTKSAILDKVNVASEKPAKVERIETVEEKDKEGKGKLGFIGTIQQFLEIGKTWLSLISEKTGHHDFVELLEQVEINLEMKKSVLSIPFAEGGGCNIIVDAIQLTNKPSFSQIATTKYSTEVLQRSLEVYEKTKQLKLSIGCGGMKVIYLTQKGDKTEALLPMKGILNVMVYMDTMNRVRMIDIEWVISSISMHITSDLAISLSKYFNRLGKEVTKGISSQMAALKEKVNEKIYQTSFIEDFLKTVKEFVLPLLDDKTTPRLSMGIMIHKGVFEFPFATMTGTTHEDTTSVFEVEDMCIALVGDASNRGFCVFIDNPKSDKVEKCLSPFEFVTSRKVDQIEHAIYMRGSYDVGRLFSEEKQLKIDVKLQGIDVGISSIFGIGGKNWIESYIQPKEKKKDEDLKIGTREEKTLNDKNNKIVVMLVNFFKDLYHGFEFSFTISDCNFKSEDKTSSVIIASKGRQNEGNDDLIKRLSEDIAKLQMANFELVEEMNTLKKQLVKKKK
ncbi:hypothetical protein EIN_086860 [Entamoeba invadens IP1]|uniref:hypothetical protein n=1 Tax=Entamoeba invadens IP1 TaxID=370355 RepID=UPI0002C3EF9F|nr:hypothetical protein EIN_086860 [Entamoeba invadens IP1]ELP85404.1 hypothetical protein EIN_086860 [Entamoeba invadens IP1]|eukprot:XP_004184750.1 hypothetical protein EIN_086860 [Entamoeba invadens IP1]